MVRVSGPCLLRRQMMVESVISLIFAQEAWDLGSTKPRSSSGSYCGDARTGIPPYVWGAYVRRSPCNLNSSGEHVAVGCRCRTEV